LSRICRGRLVTRRTEHLFRAAVVVVAGRAVHGARHAEAVAIGGSVLHRGGRGQIVVEYVIGTADGQHAVRRHATQSVIHELLLVVLLLHLLLLLVVVVGQRERAADPPLELQFGGSGDSETPELSSKFEGRPFLVQPHLVEESEWPEGDPTCCKSGCTFAVIA
jgi:hypothetical protein